jgi:hypothetical protein
MIKTFSKILEVGEMFGEESMFNRNYKRKVNAVAVSDHVVFCNFILKHIKGLNQSYSYSQVTDKAYNMFKLKSFPSGTTIF